MHSSDAQPADCIAECIRTSRDSLRNLRLLIGASVEERRTKVATSLLLSRSLFLSLNDNNAINNSEREELKGEYFGKEDLTPTVLSFQK